MADKAPEPAERPKRRLRAPSETVREKAVKHQLRADAPQKPSLFGALINGFLLFPRKIGRGIAGLQRFRVFRWVGYVVAPVYIRNSWRELKQVTWPNFKTTLGLVKAVILFSVVFGLLIAGVDYGLDKIFKEFIVK